MTRGQGLLAQLQCLLVQGLGLEKPTLHLVEIGQIIQARRYIGVARRQRVLTQLQGTLVQRLRFGEAALSIVEVG